MIKPGQEWGGPPTRPPDFEVSGDDRSLATAVQQHPGSLIRFRPSPSSDIAAAVGIDAGRTPTTVVPLDVLRVNDERVVCNMAVFGTPPDRLRGRVRKGRVSVIVDGHDVFSGAATTVVVAIGQFLRGLDVVPKGHPGDGRAEVQIYAVPRSDRAELRSRLGTGSHVPHPGIFQRSGRHVEITVPDGFSVEIDGHRTPKARPHQFHLHVESGAYRLLV